MITTPAMRNAMRIAAAATASSDRTLNVPTLEAIAAVVATHSEHVNALVEDVSYAAWKHDIKREELRAKMRRELGGVAIEQGRLPVALPTERLTYWYGWGPDAVEVRETDEWQHVEVELSMPTRQAHTA